MKHKISKDKRFVIISNHFVTIYEDNSESNIVKKFKIKLVEAVYINDSRDSVILKFEQLPNIMLKSKHKATRFFKLIFRININEWILAYSLPDEDFKTYISNSDLPGDEYIVCYNTRENTNAIIRDSVHANIV